MKNIVIVGATSAIAEAAARVYAEKNYNLYLLARNSEKLSGIASDLKIRGASRVDHQTLDATNFDTHDEIIGSVFDTLGTVDIVLIAHGTLPNQEKCQESFSTAHTDIQANAVGTVSLLTHFANHFEAQGSGSIAVITSVAGDRGRQSNYVYGASKGMVSIFLQGLRNRLYKHGVNVVDIKPGFVDTPMTDAFDKSGILWSKPQAIANIIVSSAESKNKTVYAPFYWRYIMLIIKAVPEFIFIRLNL